MRQSLYSCLAGFGRFSTRLVSVAAIPVLGNPGSSVQSQLSRTVEGDRGVPRPRRRGELLPSQARRRGNDRVRTSAMSERPVGPTLTGKRGIEDWRPSRARASVPSRSTSTTAWFGAGIHRRARGSAHRGEIIEIEPIGPPHAALRRHSESAVCGWCGKPRRSCGRRLPIRVPPFEAAARHRARLRTRSYRVSSQPATEEVLLVVEFADTSNRSTLRERLANCYARAGDSRVLDSPPRRRAASKILPGSREATSTADCLIVQATTRSLQLAFSGHVIRCAEILRLIRSTKRPGPAAEAGRASGGFGEAFRGPTFNFEH